MPRLLAGFALGLVLVFTTVAAGETQRVAGHRFACADYSQGKVFIVGTNGMVEWDYPAPSCDDLWVLPNGNVLFVVGHGVKEVTRGKATVFEYQSRSEIYACQRLANGNTFVGECTAGRLLEVTPAGAIAKEVRLLPEGKTGGHLYMRNARVLENGNYLVAHYGTEVVREYDPHGKVVKEFAAPGGPHTAVRLPNGNTIIGCGDLRKAAQVIEVDKNGAVVWRIAHDEFPGFDLKLMTGLQRLSNGNTVMSNWQGHNQFGSGPHLIEVTPGKKLVWSFADHKTMRTIASVQVMEENAETLKR